MCAVCGCLTLLRLVHIPRRERLAWRGAGWDLCKLFEAVWVTIFGLNTHARIFYPCGLHTSNSSKRWRTTKHPSYLCSGETSLRKCDCNARKLYATSRRALRFQRRKVLQIAIRWMHIKYASTSVCVCFNMLRKHIRTGYVRSAPLESNSKWICRTKLPWADDGAAATRACAQMWWVGRQFSCSVRKLLLMFSVS